MPQTLTDVSSTEPQGGTMHSPISPADFDYDKHRVPDVQNGSIQPAYVGEDEFGWSKDEVWVMGAESSGACGDYAIGPYYEARYTCGPNNDGEFMVVTEAYFVTAHRWEESPDVEYEHGPSGPRIHFDVTGMYSFTLCTDPKDPGMSEISTDTEYDDGLHAQFIWDYEEARLLAERSALSDQRGTFTWRK